jgi:hypothetical protein
VRRDQSAARSNFKMADATASSLAARDAVKIDRAAKLDAIDHSLLQGVGMRNAARSKCDTEIGFEQRDQILF